MTEMRDSFEPRCDQNKLSAFTVDRVVAGKLAFAYSIGSQVC
jgi:hypothetical protein